MYGEVSSASLRFTFVIQITMAIDAREMNNSHLAGKTNDKVLPILKKSKGSNSLESESF